MIKIYTYILYIYIYLRRPVSVGSVGFGISVVRFIMHKTSAGMIENRRKVYSSISRNMYKRTPYVSDQTDASSNRPV